MFSVWVWRAACILNDSYSLYIEVKHNKIKRTEIHNWQLARKTELQYIIWGNTIHCKYVAIKVFCKHNIHITKTAGYPVS